MITYSNNFMGPVSSWYEKNGLDPDKDFWAGGRIDVYGTGDMFTQEIGLPIMHEDDFKAFSWWIREMQTDTPWTLDKLVEHFQYWYGKEIRWYENK